MPRPAQEPAYELPPAVYLSQDIAVLFRCGKKQISKLMKEGLIPKPLPGGGGSGSPLRWSRATVDRKLGGRTQSQKTLENLIDKRVEIKIKQILGL